MYTPNSNLKHFNEMAYWGDQSACLRHYWALAVAELKALAEDEANVFTK